MCVRKRLDDGGVTASRMRPLRWPRSKASRPRSWTRTCAAGKGSPGVRQDPPQTFSYDDADHLTAVAYPGGSVTYTYDALGRQSSMTDATGVTTKTYDAASRVTSLSAPQGAVSYAYNNAGQRSSMTLPGSRTVSYGYDAGGRLASLTDWAAGITSFAYNTNDWRTAINHANAVTSSFTYDAAGQVTAVNHAGPGGALLPFRIRMTQAGIAHHRPTTGPARRTPSIR